MKHRFTLLLLLLLTIPLLAACSRGYQTSSWPGVIANDTTAFAATGTYVFAVNTTTGQEIWRYPAEADNKRMFYAPPALTPDGQLIVGDYAHTLYSLNPENGLENWSFSNATYGYMAGALATEDSIFAVTNNGQIFALNMSGQERWNVTLESKIGIWASPITNEACGCIFVASMDHHVYALNAEDGSLLWQSDTMNGAIVGPPALSEEDILYVSSFSAKLSALDAADGSPVVAPFIADDWIWSSPVLIDGQLIFGDQTGNLYWLKVDDLSLDKKIDGEDPIISTPLVLTETIYVTTSGGSLIMYDRDGNPQGTLTVEGQLLGPAVQAGDLILVAPVDGQETLIAFDHSGLKKWGFVPEKK